MKNDIYQGQWILMFYLYVLFSSPLMFPFIAELQKDFFIWYPDFHPKNVQIMYFQNFSTTWCIKLNKCLFSSWFYSIGLELCHKSKVLRHFYAKYAKICINYFKRSRLPPRNVRYPRYQDTDLLQLCFKGVNIDFCPYLQLENSSSVKVSHPCFS